jgi:quercetin dioxygenase-like cupin family protein
MIFWKKWGSAFAAFLGIALAMSYAGRGTVAANPAPDKDEQDRVAIAHDLPKMDGGHLKATVVEVTYGPGGFSKQHSHPCPVIGYVIEGAYRTQVKGEAEAVYRAGDTFYESPNGIHQISSNASNTQKVKFLAYFLCDHDKALSIDVPEAKDGRGK